MIVYVKQTSL